MCYLVQLSNTLAVTQGSCLTIGTAESAFPLLVQVQRRFPGCCDRCFIYLISSPYVNWHKHLVIFHMFFIDEGNNFKVKKHSWGHRVTKCLLAPWDRGCARWSLLLCASKVCGFFSKWMWQLYCYIIITVANIYWVIKNYQTCRFLNLAQPVIKTQRFREGK